MYAKLVEPDGNQTHTRWDNMIRKLTPGEFNSIVKFLKRLDDIGDDFFLYGNVIVPSVRCPANFPGMHIVRSDLPLFEEYKETLYAMYRIGPSSAEMGEAKGKKVLIELEQNEVGIWIRLNENQWQIAGIYSTEADEDGQSQAEIAEQLKPKSNDFEVYMNSVEWSVVPPNIIEDIKNGSVCTLEDERKTTYVRFGKDVLKLRGSIRRDMPAKFTLDVSIVSPLSSEDVIVVNTMSGGLDSGTLMIHMEDQTIECIHYYKFSPFK